MASLAATAEQVGIDVTKETTVIWDWLWNPKQQNLSQAVTWSQPLFELLRQMFRRGLK
jgi:hypothetical protein